MGNQLPILHSRLDWLILAWMQEHQNSGLIGVTDRLKIDNVLLAKGAKYPSISYILQELHERSIPVHQAYAGQVVSLGGNTSLTVNRIGELGMSMTLSHGKARILFIPGADPSWWEELSRAEWDN